MISADRVALRYASNKRPISPMRAKKMWGAVTSVMADVRWNRDWTIVLARLAGEETNGDLPHADEYNYAYHALTRDIQRYSAYIDDDLLVTLSELQGVFLKAKSA